MAVQKLIAVREFCLHHNISVEVIRDLYQHEIIDLVLVKRSHFIAEKNLSLVEKAVRLHSELDINVNGIQAVLHLLQNLEKKEAELNAIKNQLEFYLKED